RAFPAWSMAPRNRRRAPRPPGGRADLLAAAASRLRGGRAGVRRVLDQPDAAPLLGVRLRSSPPPAAGGPAARRLRLLHVLLPGLRERTAALAGRVSAPAAPGVLDGRLRRAPSMGHGGACLPPHRAGTPPRRRRDDLRLRAGDGGLRGRRR